MSGGLVRGLPETQLDVPRQGAAERPSRWGDLRLRVASAAILVPLGLAALWFAPWSWALLLTMAAVGMGLEWVSLCGAGKAGAASLLLADGVLLAAWSVAAGWPALALAVLLLFAALIWLAVRRQANRWALAAGVLYIGVPLVCLVWLRADPRTGSGDILFLLLVIWCGDIGAYAAGRWFGGAKLAPRISPGKTWSGAAGGLLASMLAGLATSLVLGGASAWVLPVAAAMGLAGQAGDLLESAVKRRAGVKDSGRSIPGHGGLLDRLDAVLTAAPVAAALAWAAGPGLYLWR